MILSIWSTKDICIFDVENPKLTKHTSHKKIYDTNRNFEIIYTKKIRFTFILETSIIDDHNCGKLFTNIVFLTKSGIFFFGCCDFVNGLRIGTETIKINS